MFRKIVFVLSILILICGNSFAEKQEWIDNTYDFTKVKTILLLDTTIPNELKNGINELEIKDVFDNKSKIIKVKVITVPELLQLMNKNNSMDDLINIEDKPDELQKEIYANAGFYVDLIIRSSVIDYKKQSVFRRGFSYNTTQNQVSHVTGGMGTMTIQTPVTVTNNVPDRYIPQSAVTVSWDIFEATTLKKVFSRIDNRVKSNQSLIIGGSPQPKHLYEQIDESFFNDLNDKFKK